MVVKLIIKNLRLQNYRNFEKLNLIFNPNLNIFIGNNAQGKTNILESIYVLGMTKSFLQVDDSNLISFDKGNFFISGEVVLSEKKKKFQVSMADNTKILKINNKVINKNSDYVSKINVIVFSPNDLKLIKYNPMFRRRFINMEISQLDNFYVKLMNEYNLLLKKRNSYLKQLKNGESLNELFFNLLNNKFIDLAIKVYLKRKEFFQLINDEITNIFFEISGFSGLKIKYLTSFNIEDENLADLFKKKLEINFEKEKLQGVSLYGPHRDDFCFFLNDLEMDSYCSQGQQRMAILSLKLAEINIFKKIKEDNPIILLDDIFSELDTDKQNKLIKYINQDIQTIITTTDLNKINESLLNNAKIFKVIDGKVEVIKNE